MSSDDLPPYLAGLVLRDRTVVVVGGGSVANRRIPALLAAGARVVVVSPAVTPAIEGMTGELTWVRRGFEPADLDDAWYVVAATNDPAVNEAVSEAAEARRVFCVRSDDATRATAWTPATGRHGEVQVAVLGASREQRDPRRSAHVRDAIVRALQGGSFTVDPGHKAPGVTLVGGGPGDPGLITVAGRQALAEADVVVTDRLAPRELLSELGAHVEVIDVTKLPRGRAAGQEEINKVIVDRALAGKSVVRLKGGDNYVFGRGFEELLACEAAGVPVRVVPGLSSAFAVPALAGIPLTHRGMTHDCSVLSGHLPPGHPESLIDYDALGRMNGTIVMLMAVQNAAAIAEALIGAGRSGGTPVAVVCNGTMPTQRRIDTTLAELGASITEHDVVPPAIIVIGDVAGLTSAE